MSWYKIHEDNQSISNQICEYHEENKEYSKESKSRWFSRDTVGFTEDESESKIVWNPSEHGWLWHHVKIHEEAREYDRTDTKQRKP